jgi:thiol:disulfide interchange protein
MKNILRTILAILLLAVTASATSAGYDPKRDPAADVKAAVHAAQGSGKRILLDVGGEWCVWCHVFEDLVAGDKEVGARLRDGFVVVKVNWSPENENTRFLSAYPPIPAYPHFFVLESNGTFLWSQSGGDLVKGTAYDRTKILAFLKKWSPPSPSKSRKAQR